jgi:hypothetical protein
MWIWTDTAVRSRLGVFQQPRLHEMIMGLGCRDALAVRDRSAESVSLGRNQVGRSEMIAGRSGPEAIRELAMASQPALPPLRLLRHHWRRVTARPAMDDFRLL